MGPSFLAVSYAAAGGSKPAPSPNQSLKAFFLVPRFVILRHEVPPGHPRGSHFDLMFEVDGVLATWAAESLPVLGGPAVAAVPLQPHRIAYLDYEGPISNDRGTVRRVASGTYERPRHEAGRSEFEVTSPSIRGRLVFAAGGVRLQSAADGS